jgi:hypothetical protein
MRFHGKPRIGRLRCRFDVMFYWLTRDQALRLRASEQKRLLGIIERRAKEEGKPAPNKLASSATVLPRAGESRRSKNPGKRS